MIDDRILELINKDVDGTILPAEREMLDDYRKRDPEIDPLAEGLRQMVADLDGIQAVEPPPTLAPGVRRALQSAEDVQPQVVRQPSPIREFATRFGRMHLAYAFSGGAVLGALLVALLLKTGAPAPVHAEDAAGAVITGLPAGTRLEQGPVVPISAPGVQGTISTQYIESIVLFTVKISSVDRLRARYSFDPASIDVRAFQRGSTTDNTLGVQGNILEIQSRGTDAYTVYFDRKSTAATPIRFTLYTSDTQVFDRTLSVGR